jgi:hypothetical protein
MRPTPVVANTTHSSHRSAAPYSHAEFDRTARLEEVEDAFNTAILIQERYSTGATTPSKRCETDVAHLAYCQPTIEDTALWRVSVKVCHNSPITPMSNPCHFAGWRGIQWPCATACKSRSVSRRHLGCFYSTITPEFNLYQGAFSCGDTTLS